MNIVVTGASSGLGFEIVLELCKNEENNILALSRNLEKLQHLEREAKTANAHCQINIVSFDLGKSDLSYLKNIILETLGTVDILINNAGQLINKRFLETTEEDFQQMFDANVLSHFKLSQLLIPLMNPHAHIVNISSMGGYQGSVKFPGLAAYSASKAALAVLTECMAVELESETIRVNCLALGSVQTEMLEKAFPGYQSPINAKTMAQYVAEFALNGSKIYNGKVLPVSVTTP